jgi:hypothetical protein
MGKARIWEGGGHGGVYNELVALKAGAGLLGNASFLSSLIRTKPNRQRRLGGVRGATGLLPLVPGLHTMVTRPFG